MSRQGILENWDVFLEWVKTGCVVQFRSDSMASWRPTVHNDPLWSEYVEYRKKPAEPVVIERWLNVYSNGEVQHLTKEMADHNAMTDHKAMEGRIACVKLTGSYIPGED